MFIAFGSCRWSENDWSGIGWIIPWKPYRRGYAWKNHHDELCTSKRHSYRAKPRIGDVDLDMGWFRSRSVISKGLFSRGQGIARYFISKENVRVPSNKARTFLWAPAPAVASVAIEKLQRARHTNEKILFTSLLVPGLTNRWQKFVLKEADFVFEVPAGTAGIWERDTMHEPLLIAVCLPFLEHSPLKIGGTPRILALGRQLRGVWKDSAGDPRLILRKLFNIPRRLSGVLAELVRRVLYSAGEQ
jgi:hypothetical protein